MTMKAIRVTETGGPEVLQYVDIDVPKPGPGEVLVSRTVRDLSAGSGLAFEDRGSHPLKGVPDEWQLFRVTNS